MSSTGQRWVSACLASRVNWYGIPVTLSARGNHPLLRNFAGSELTTYQLHEGAFWGNLFIGEYSYLFACHNDSTVAASRARYRDCAAGHLGLDGSISACGAVTIVGSCATWCGSLEQGHYYKSCVGPTGSSNEVVTTFLQ